MYLGHKFTKLFFVLGLVLLVNIGFAANVPKVTGVRASVNQDKTRLVLDVSDLVQYKLFTLSKPDRVVLDIKNGKLATKISSAILKKTPVKKIRTNETKSNLRLVLDLQQKVKPTAFLLKPSGPYGERLVIDLQHTNDKTVATTLTKIPTPTPELKLPQKTDELRDILVVIDPGHGGKDPGAMGKKGTREKDVVLAIAKKLQREFQRVPGYKAVLTRGKDNYIPLRGRLRSARKGSADVFISIHADAFKNNRARGASVFALSQRGASSEAARWLAAKENYSELGGVVLDDKSDVLRSVLLDLSQTATVASSLLLGDTVLQQLDSIGRLHNKKVEQAGFVVLKSPDIPSVLVETGFISNSQEEKLLRSSSYQSKLAKSIARGVKKYFSQYAPQGTLIGARKNGRRYVVARGDSLSRIAQKFQVSMNSIKINNKLKSDVIRKGQVLQIPASQG